MRLVIAAVIFLISTLLLFTRLGHYALWDDEAVTALAGRGVWRTGDTSVVLDHNVVAYRSGLLLKGTSERSTPPLGAYLVAPFAGLSHGQPGIVRLPFALLGLGSVVLILLWLFTVDAKWLTWVLFGMAIIGNVSFWLYNRQCRYYSPAIFSSIAVAYLYLNWNGSRWQLALMAAAALMLLASNYLNYLALQVCMLGDYLIIGRKRRMLGLIDWMIVLIPQILIGGIIVMIWNTLGTGNKEYIQGNSFGQRLTLTYMNLRDINLCEYGAGLLMLAAPVIYFVTRVLRSPSPGTPGEGRGEGMNSSAGDSSTGKEGPHPNPLPDYRARGQEAWLIRAPLILVVYVAIVAFLSPQILPSPLPAGMPADVRYLAPVIPLCVAIGVLVILETARVSNWLALGIAFLAFGFNWLNGSFILNDPQIPSRSTIVSFVGELIDPPGDPYTPAINWIREHVKPKESIWVVPDFMTYPLMYEAPEPIYAWQFTQPPPPELKDLPPIHLYGRQMPDFIFAFGGAAAQVIKLLQDQRAPYALVAHPECTPQVYYRPELFWHRFKAGPLSLERGEAVFIFQHLTNPPQQIPQPAPAAAPGELRL